MKNLATSYTVQVKGEFSVAIFGEDKSVLGISSAGLEAFYSSGPFGPPGNWKTAPVDPTDSDQQSIYDWSGNENHLQVGSTTGVDVNDAADLEESRNLAIAGTTENLQSGDWTLTDASAGSATTFTPSAADGQITQSFTGVSGAVYIISTIISSAGNTSLEWTLDAVETSVNVTGTNTRYSIEYTGDGAAANIGLRDPNASGFGAITFTEFQIERAPTGTSPTPYTNPSNPIFVGARCDYDGSDDYGVTSGNVLDGTAGTIIALVRTTAYVASNGAAIFANRDTALAVNPGQLFSVSLGLLRANFSDGVDYIVQAANTRVDDGLWHVGATKFTATETGDIFLDGNSDVTPFSMADVDAGVGDYNDAIGALAKGTSYHNLDGQVPFVLIFSRELTSEELSVLTKNLAQAAWDYRGIPCFGVSGVDYTTEPRYI